MPLPSSLPDYSWGMCSLKSASSRQWLRTLLWTLFRFSPHGGGCVSAQPMRDPRIKLAVRRLEQSDAAAVQRLYERAVGRAVWLPAEVEADANFAHVSQGEAVFVCHGPEGRLVREPEDSGPPVGYWAFLRDPDGHTLEIAYGQELGLAVEHTV